MLHRCRDCALIVDKEDVCKISGYVYHTTCGELVKAKREFPESYKKWEKIKRTIKYLDECNPREVWAQSERLDIILNSFGFDVDKI